MPWLMQVKTVNIVYASQGLLHRVVNIVYASQKGKKWQMVEEKKKGGQMVETDRYWLEGKKEGVED